MAKLRRQAERYTSTWPSKRGGPQHRTGVFPRIVLAVSDLQRRINQLEEIASQSEMLSERPTDAAVRNYDRRFAAELRDLAEVLRRQMEELQTPKAG
jgi:hypothetical protein